VTFSHSSGEDASDLSEKRRLIGLRHQRGVNAVADERCDLVASEPQRLRAGAIVLLHVAAEIGGIVGIHRHHEAFVHHPSQRMMREIIDHA
jgi:hypothetical protein